MAVMFPKTLMNLILKILNWKYITSSENSWMTATRFFILLNGIGKEKMDHLKNQRPIL